MKGCSNMLLLVLTMVFGSVQLASSQCDQNHFPSDVIVNSSLGEIGGVNLSDNEVAIDDEIFILISSTIFCSNNGEPLDKGAIIAGSTVVYDFNEKNELISLVVQDIPDENVDEVFVQKSTPARGENSSPHDVDNGIERKKSTRAAVFFENGIWKNYKR